MKKKSIILIVVIFILIGTLIFIGFAFYKYLKSPEQKLGLGTEIEQILISENGKTAYIKLKGESSDKNITKIKFIFTDKESREYNYETEEGAQEIAVPYSIGFWDWLFGQPVYNGTFDYKIDSSEINLSDFNNITNVSFVFVYQEEGNILETPKLDTGTNIIRMPSCNDKIKNGNETGVDCGGSCRACSSGGGGGGGYNPPSTTCTPESKETTCGNYCGIKKNNCNEDVNCTCQEGTYCYIGEGTNNICINNSITCIDSDNKNHDTKGNVTLCRGFAGGKVCSFYSDDCNINLTEYYCYYNGSIFEARNESYECEYGCLDGKCLGPACTNESYCKETSCADLTGCYNNEHRIYYNVSNKCVGRNCEVNLCNNYTSDNCTDCSCNCGGYNETESLANKNCNDGKDNDCDGFADTDAECLTSSTTTLISIPPSPITYPASSNFSCANSARLSVTLRLNGINITSQNNQNIVRGANAIGYNVSCSALGNKSYTGDSDETTYIINKATPAGSISGGGTFTYPIQTSVQGSETNTGDGDAIYLLFRNGISVSNLDARTLGAGTWNYIYNTTGGQNYSSISSIASTTAVINQNTTYTLRLSGTTPITSGATGNVTGSNCPSQLTCNLYRNRTLVLNPDTSVLEAGSYNYTYNTTGNANYSSKQVSFILTVNGLECTHNNNCSYLSNMCAYGICNSSNKCQQMFNLSAICRASTGVCDITEKCTGTNATCPTDIFNLSSTPCGTGKECDGNGNCVDISVCNNNGTCDSGETCANCPSDCCSSSKFMFVAWGDTKTGTASLTALSVQAKALNPKFTLYSGDLCDSYSTSCIQNTWKNALNGNVNNGMFNISFVVRGNHDSGDNAGWQGIFDMQGVANKVGATNYNYMSGLNDIVYSFDYGNSHFVGLDSLGDANTLTSSQLAWLDDDLTSAESRGLTHAFIYFHGPIYCVDSHCSCTTSSGCDQDSTSNNGKIIPIINKHPIVSATFHGHEHIYAWVHLDSTRVSAITHPWEEFVTGDAGAGPKTCISGRTDFCMQEHGFVTVDVDGPTVTVKFYKQGSTTVQKTVNFTTCINDAQCQGVFGSGYTCENGKCVSGVKSLSPFTKLWSWMKSFLTGNAILTGKAITENSIKKIIGNLSF